MASPVSSTLTQLDDSVRAWQSQLDRLQAALEVDDEQLRRSLAKACQQAATLCDLVRAERPDAQWRDRKDLDQLIQDLEHAAEERRNQQRRSRLLELADELNAGSVQHRSAARAAALNTLRLQAVEELRRQAGAEVVNELPGPKASEWLHWAFNLQDGVDAPLLAALRRDFPALERFSGELEERYWTPSGKAPEPPPSPRPAQKAEAGPSAPPSRPEPVRRSELATQWSASTAAVILPPSDLLPHTVEKIPGEADASRVDHAVAVAQDARLNSTLQVAAVPEPAGQPAPETGEHVFSGLGEAASPERHVAIWIAAASVVVLGAALAGIHYFHGRANHAPGTTAGVVQDSDLNVARAATTGEATPPGGAPESNDSMAGANLSPRAAGENVPGATSTEAKLDFPTLHRQPVEGAQDKILLSMEFCRRVNPGSIECWGYVSNLGAGGARVSLDRADVVDGKGNTFSLDRNSQFDFPTGKSSSLPPGSRVKYTVRVPDKDPGARTLTLYLDVSNPTGLEYTFRDIPVAE